MMANPSHSFDPLSRLGAICAEAVQVHGEDMPLIRAHVTRALEALSPQERAELETMIERVLAWQAARPPRPFH